MEYLTNPQSSNAIENFFQNHSLGHYKPKERVVRPGDLDNYVVYFKSGHVRISTETASGRERTLHMLNSSNGFLALGLSNYLTIYSMTAITNVTAWRVPKDLFLEFLISNPAVLLEITRRVLKTVRELLEQIEWLKYASSYDRTLHAIYYIAQNFGAPEPDSRAVIPVKFTHQEIADMTGLTRETVTNQISKLKDDGLISYSPDKRIIINRKNLSAPNLSVLPF